MSFLVTDNETHRTLGAILNTLRKIDERLAKIEASRDSERSAEDCNVERGPQSSEASPKPKK